MAGMAVAAGVLERPGKQVAACEYSSRRDGSPCKLDVEHCGTAPLCAHPPVAQSVREAGRHVAGLLRVGGFLLLAKCYLEAAWADMAVLALSASNRSQLVSVAIDRSICALSRLRPD